MKKNILALFFTFICLLFMNVAFGQEIISGTIVDSTTGEPVIGASINLQGTEYGDISDFDGKFKLNANIGSTLVISILGYHKTEVFVDKTDLGIINLKEDSIVFDGELFMTCAPCQNKFKSHGSVNIIKPDNFNQSNIWDPAMLIQGKIPGLSIYKRGGNPNSLSTMRIRGIYTMGDYVAPLIVIDDVVGASIENVDPQDIASFEVLKDGSSAAIYGMRGTAGVIKITTKKAASNTPTLQYNGQVGVSTSVSSINILTPEQFRAAGGLDLGSNTNWLQEIIRNGMIHNHNFVTQVAKNNINARLSANLRSTQGTLKTTGFEKINLRGNFNTKLLKEKLHLNLNGSWTNRNAKIGFEDAFYFAQIQNPTAPIFAKDGIFAVNTEQYGGYYENIGLYNSYNPVSIIEQNRRVGKHNLINYNSHVSYHFSKDLAIHVNYASENTNDDFRAINLPTSIYEGSAIKALGKGKAEQLDINRNFNLWESYARYKKDIKSMNLDLTAGYAFQNTNRESKSIELADFYANAEIFNDLFNTAIDAKKRKQVLKKLPNDRIISFYTSAKVSFNQDAIMLNASIRRDGSNRLGENNKWGNFPALGGSIDFSKYLDLGRLETMRMRLGYGITGLTPTTFGLSKGRIDTIIVAGVRTLRESVAPNPDLKWETKREMNIGFDIAMNRVTASVDFFERKIYDFITYKYNFEPGSKAIFANDGEINGKGIELSLNIDLINKSKFQYSTGLVYAHSTSILKESFTDYLGGQMGGPGGSGSRFIAIKKGEELGSFYGPVFDKVGPDGSQLFKDLNGDGAVSNYIPLLNGRCCGPNDVTKLGNGNPNHEIGWNNELNVSGWNINAFFRGAFGHSLVNGMRLFHESSWPQYLLGSYYNQVSTSLKVDGLKYAPTISSIFIEKADFFRLDNFTIARRINLSKSKIKDLKISLTGQNLFVLTNYTGPDPDPILVDDGIKLPQNIGYTLGPDIFRHASERSMLDSGIDQRTSYLPSRSIVLGVSLGL
jgi:TonB-dependent starch-binding outer membrane protein SusC